MSFESVQALPNFKTVQRSEESIGMGCMHAPLCQILHVRRELGGDKGGMLLAFRDSGTVKDWYAPGSVSESASFQAPETVPYCSPS